MTLELRGVTRTYGRGATAQRALSNVDFALEEGVFTLLVGASGSGKTTLLNMLGLLDRPDDGQVLFDGNDTAAWSESRRADMRGGAIGFVFQTGDLIPVLSAEQNARLPLDIAGVPARQATARTLEVLDLVGLSPHRGRRPDALSGGQRQRVAIARALVRGPRYVFADEPTASLDSETADSVARLLHSLCNEKGVTILIATHDERLTAHATRLVRLLDGRIVEDRRTGV